MPNSRYAYTHFFQVEEVSKHGLAKLPKEKKVDVDGAEMEETFEIRHESARRRRQTDRQTDRDRE